MSAWLQHPAPLRLAPYLLLALLLRLPAVFFADGFDYPDQQYQYIDPAWHLATGAAWHRTWEWQAGMRSWVYPELLAAVFRGLGALGCTEPMATMRAVRGVHALWSLLPMIMFWLVVVRWRPVARPRPALLWFALSGLLVLQVQPSGPSFAATLAVAAVLAAQGPGWWPAFGGLCLGFAFCGRFQDALYGPGVVLALAWQRRSGAAAAFTVACLPGIVTQGLSDLSMGGGFLSSPLANLRVNVGDGAAAGWTTQPWWFFWLVGVVPVCFFVPPLLRDAWRRFAAGATLLPVATVAALGHLLAHSFIARKALRFEYASLAMLCAVLLAGLGAANGRRATWHLRLFGLVHGSLFLWASFAFGNAGAVGATLWLRDHPGPGQQVFVVDAPATVLGGFYYLRPEADRVRAVQSGELAALVAAGQLPVGAVLVTARKELAVVVPGARFELEGSFPGQFDLRRGERRLVYRRRE